MKSLSRQIGEDAPNLSRKIDKSSRDYLSNLELQLSVNIGSLKLSGNDLLELSKGQMFTLEGVKGELLELTIDGEKIGEAQLIDENGKYFLEIITTIFDADEQQ